MSVGLVLAAALGQVVQILPESPNSLLRQMLHCRDPGLFQIRAQSDRVGVEVDRVDVGRLVIKVEEPSRNKNVRRIFIGLEETWCEYLESSPMMNGKGAAR